ncbi:hypothetical protein DL96DRAFT_1614852 [Flagelloscypha sp. PMI_526]|nr:hypothetical protein DL96DRAFT_1614852 [Flagelloscypha sp. PMI_526]
MAKAKTPTSQEIYKERQEREKEAANYSLPPGLVNHGNTCFMNSVVQGLIATRLLKDLVEFKPIPQRLLDSSSVLIAPQRSPQLTNSHENYGGEFIKPFSDQMPIGDVFVTMLIRAWSSQDSRKKETLTPRALLNAVGKKYDQYLDFAQQDAHEFLRILLDAMSMEEMDVIKKRQPIPKLPKGKPLPPPTIPESERLISFSDMIFGGRLTSVLVCQKCKHISQTYEDFYDLSLSVKPEDYARERKRDRFKNFAKKFKLPSAASSTIGLAPISVPVHETRSSSVPPTPKERDDNEMLNGIEDPPIIDERRRSVDILAPEVPTPEPSPNGSVDDGPSPSTPDSAPLHVEFKDGAKEKDKRLSSVSKKDNWNKLGRRISVTMGLTNRKGRDRTSKDLHQPMPQQLTNPEPVPQIVLSRHNSPTDEASTSRAPSISPQPSPSLTKEQRRTSRPRSLSPRKKHKTSSSDPEVEYLRRVLADVSLSSSSPNFPLFRASTAPGDQLAKLSMAGGSLQSIEECLKMFTAVEILDGENRVGCRRCWKIQNGVDLPNGKRKGGEAEEVDSDDEDCPGPEQDLASAPGPSPRVESIRSLSDASDASTFSTLSSVASPSSSSSLDGEESSRTSFDTPFTPMTARPSDSPFPSPPPVPPKGPSLTRDHTLRPVSLPPPPKPENHRPHANGASGSPLRASLALPPRNRRQRTISDTSMSSLGDTTTDDEEGQRKKRRNLPFSHRPINASSLTFHLPVLVIHLKRFQQVPGASARSKKIDDYVAFPECLDLKPFLAPRKEEFGGMVQRKSWDGDCMYRLYAVVVHLGNMLGGHYVAYVALPPGEEGDKSPGKSSKRQWAYVSDTVVRLTTLEEVLKTKAYICFYERV